MAEDFKLLEDKDIKRISGTISKKLPSTSTNPKAPAGRIHLNGLDEYKDGFTVWDKNDFAVYEEGDEARLEYKESEFNGYINKNVSDIFPIYSETKDIKPVTVITQNGSYIDDKNIEGLKHIEITPTKVDKPKVEFEDKKVMPRDIKEKNNPEDINGPDPSQYYIVMKGKRYRLIPDEYQIVHT